MVEVINLGDIRAAVEDAKLENTPHAAGTARCLACQHEWECVAPMPNEGASLECPACGLKRGSFKFSFGVPEGDLIFTCPCGSELFQYVQRNKSVQMPFLLCTGCGGRPEY